MEFAWKVKQKEIRLGWMEAMVVVVVVVGVGIGIGIGVGVGVRVMEFI